MSFPADPYRDWDVAYVLGSLSPSDRRSYERHLAECLECDAAVASIAGTPGILSTLPRENAVELLDQSGKDDIRPPPELVRNLGRAVRSARRRARIGIAAALVAAAMTGGVVAWQALPVEEVPSSTPPASPMTQTMPSPVTANVALVREPWGTRIEVTCTYVEPESGPESQKFGYALYIELGQGRQPARVATWSAGPGSTTRPVATVEIPPTGITGVQIRLVGKDLVLLEARF